MTGRRVGRGDDGVTLIELLVAMVIGVLIMGAVTASFALALRANAANSRDLDESHDAQLVAAYLPADLLSAENGLTITDVTADTGCTASPSDGYNVVRFAWRQLYPTPATNFVAAYRVQKAGQEWQLVRFSCAGPASPPNTSATTLVVARNLRPVTVPNDLPAFSLSGSSGSIRLTDVSGYAYTIAGTSRLALASASPTPSSTPSPEPVLPTATAVELVNRNTSGDVDVRVTYSAPIPAACKTQFALAGLSGRGTYSGTAAVSGTTATLQITRGANIPNTEPGALRLSLAGTGSCTVAPLSEVTPQDSAAPVMLAVNFVNGPTGIAARPDTGDSIVATFSEAVPMPATMTGFLTDGGNNGTDTVTAASLFQSAVNLGRQDYVTGGNNRTLNFSGAVSTAGNTVTALLAVGGCAANNQSNCAVASTAAGLGTISVVPAGSIADGSGNSLSKASLTPASLTTANAGAF